MVRASSDMQRRVRYEGLSLVFAQVKTLKSQFAAQLTVEIFCENDFLEYPPDAPTIAHASCVCGPVGLLLKDPTEIRRDLFRSRFDCQ